MRPMTHETQNERRALTQDSRRTSVHQAQRHHQRQVRPWVVPPLRLQRGRALWGAERELYFVGRDVPKNLEQVIRVESDIERIAVVADGKLVGRFTEVRGLDAE